MGWMDENGLLFLWDKIKAKFATTETLNSEISSLRNSMSSLGYGDMMKSIYDADGDGVVDNAAKVNGHTVGKDVPSDAVFTDTVYTHPAHTAKTSGLYKITVNSLGHVTAATAVAKSDITALGIPAQDTTYSEATTENAGLMSQTDKEKVDGIPDDPKYTDTIYTHPLHAAKTSGLYKVTVDSLGHVTAVVAVTKDDITGLGIPAQDTTYSAATTSANGLMSSSDKTKLNALPTNATLESTYAKKTDITGVYKYKGSVADESKLPTSGVETGWVYDIQSASQYGGAGANVAWNGTNWDALGEVFTITAITNAEIDAICV